MRNGKDNGVQGIFEQVDPGLYPKELLVIIQALTDAEYMTYNQKDRPGNGAGQAGKIHKRFLRRLYRRYVPYCEAEGQTPMSEEEFGNTYGKHIEPLLGRPDPQTGRVPDPTAESTDVLNAVNAMAQEQDPNWRPPYEVRNGKVCPVEARPDNERKGPDGARADRANVQTDSSGPTESANDKGQDTSSNERPTYLPGGSISPAQWLFLFGRNTMRGVAGIHRVPRHVGKKVGNRLAENRARYWESVNPLNMAVSDTCEENLAKMRNNLDRIQSQKLKGEARFRAERELLTSTKNYLRNKQELARKLQATMANVDPGNPHHEESLKKKMENLMQPGCDEVYKRMLKDRENFPENDQLIKKMEKMMVREKAIREKAREALKDIVKNAGEAAKLLMNKIMNALFGGKGQAQSGPAL